MSAFKKHIKTVINMNFERRWSVQRARRCLQIARRINKLLHAYGNQLGSIDEESKTVVIEIWDQLNCGGAFFEMTLKIGTLENCEADGDFALNEAKTILATKAFFSMAQGTLNSFLFHQKEFPEKYQKWPRAKKRLKRIYQSLQNLSWPIVNEWADVCENRFRLGESIFNPFDLPLDREEFDFRSIEEAAAKNGYSGKTRQLRQHLANWKSDDRQKGETWRLGKNEVEEFLRYLSEKKHKR